MASPAQISFDAKDLDYNDDSYPDNNNIDDFADTTSEKLDSLIDTEYPVSKYQQSVESQDSSIVVVQHPSMKWQDDSDSEDHMTPTSDLSSSSAQLDPPTSPDPAPSFTNLSQTSIGEILSDTAQQQWSLVNSPHLLKSVAMVGPSAATHATSLSRNEATKRKPLGGRMRRDHFPEHARDKMSRTRKLDACWRCKMHRDPCPDDGTPCARCISGAQKGYRYYFDCDRSNLPDFIMDFLPPSHTVMYSKQSIEDCVKEQVFGWHNARPIVVHLSSGYGPSLKWEMYEFKPASPELMEQLQYVQDVSTGQSVRCKKWSPPLGILKLDACDVWHMKSYLDKLLSYEHLPDFAWRLFEEESQIDDFQATMLDLVCKLYEKTNDPDLSHLLQRVLRMLLINYIMAHTLTITQETLPSVHHHLRNPDKPNYLTPFTSPRLANRQLKFFFSLLRERMFNEILKWQQEILHASGGKDCTWLHTFIVMLALAMVLEESQRTIQIQADAKVHKLECSHAKAQSEAANACERIDARFTLLVGLFQCKYRDKKWTRGGSFGPQTPRLRNQVEHEFCEELRDLLVEKQDYLRSRKDVPFSSQTQCQYTTRLVARFLLPFLDLPG